MVRQVIGHKGRNKEVAVVVAFLHAELDGNGACLASVHQIGWPELLAQKLIGPALIDQDRTAKGCRFRELGGVVAVPVGNVVAEVPR